MELSTYLIHYLRTSGLGEGPIVAFLLLVVTPSITALAMLWYKIEPRLRGVVRAVVGGSFVACVALISIGPIAAAMVTQSRHSHGQIDEPMLFGDSSDVVIAYHLIYYYEDDVNDISYDLVRFNSSGEVIGEHRLAMLPTNEAHSFWQRRVGDVLFSSSRGEAQVIDLKTLTSRYTHAELARRQPIFKAPVKLLAAGGDDRALWIEDEGGLRYKIDAQTLEATRISAEEHRALPINDDAARPRLGAPDRPKGCEDQATLDAAYLADAPRRQTISFNGERVEGDGWISPGFVYDRARGCAIQPSASGGAVLLVHSRLEEPLRELVGVDASGEQAWQVALGWPVQERLIVAEVIGDALLLVWRGGEATMINYRSGAKVWGVGRGELARWWGEGVGVTVHATKIDGDALDLWVSEQGVTMHHVRRSLKDGSLITSVGF